MRTNVTLCLDVDFVIRFNEFVKKHELQKSKVHTEAVESYMADYEKKKRSSKK